MLAAWSPWVTIATTAVGRLQMENLRCLLDTPHLVASMQDNDWLPGAFRKGRMLSGVDMLAGDILLANHNLCCTLMMIDHESNLDRISNKLVDTK